MLDFNSLPFELHRRIAEFTCFKDLRSLRLVNKQLAAAAAWPLFKTIHFSGPASLRRLPKNNDRPKRGNAEYGRLHETIETALPIARYAKSFHFDPAYYREGFWQDYRAYIEAQIDEPIDEPELSEDDPEDSDGSDDIDGKYERAIEREQELRNARPALEAPLIEEGERFFRQKMEEQISNAGRISSALKSLFEVMTVLERVEIKPWEFANFEELEFESWDADIARGDSSSMAVFIESLAVSMQSVGQHVTSLHLTGLDPESLNLTSATRYLFTGLTELRVDTSFVGFMLEDAPVSSKLESLLKCCQPSLQKLEIIGGGKHPQLPSRGEHDILKMFPDQQHAKAPVFPELQVFKLGSLIVNAVSLISFITRQPQLQSLSFSFIYLATPAVNWPMLFSAFPDSVRHIRVVGQLGHEPHPGFVAPIAYNHIKPWHPLNDDDKLPEESGWKAQMNLDWTIDFYRTEDGN